MNRMHKTLIATALVVAAVPAQSMAATPFGAKLTPDVQPSNAGTAHPCPIEGQACTRVLMDAYGRPDQPAAPRKGTIKRIKLIAGEAGSFKLQLARVGAASQQAKIVRNGPTIDYEGQPQIEEDPETYRVESFRVNLKVGKGERLAIRSKATSTLRCSSGGPNQLIFQPPLSLGNPFTTASDTDGCWLLLEAVIR